MNKPYHLLELSGQPGICAVVIATSYVNPPEHLLEMEQELAQRGLKGNIVFDLMLATGSTEPTDRFFIGEFDGQKFTRYVFEPADGLAPALAPRMTQLYRELASALDLSVLPRQKQLALKEGISF